jgi:hypothetical protein
MCLNKILYGLNNILKQNGLFKETKTGVFLPDVTLMSRRLKYFNDENIKMLYAAMLTIAKEAEIDKFPGAEDAADIIYEIINRAFKPKIYDSTIFFKEILSVFNDYLKSSTQYELINSSMLTKNYRKKLEYWTDEPCLMIEYNYFKEDLSFDSSTIRKIYNSIN